MTNKSAKTLKQPAIQALPGPYCYHRDAEGVDDLWVIRSQPADCYVASISFWDEPDSDEAAQSEASARLLTAAPVLRDALKRLLAVVAELPREILNVDLYEAELCAATVLAQVEGGT